MEIQYLIIMKKTLTILLILSILILPACSNSNLKNNTSTNTSNITLEQSKETPVSDKVEFAKKTVDALQNIKSFHLEYQDSEETSSIDFLLDETTKETIAFNAKLISDETLYLVGLENNLYLSDDNQATWKHIDETSEYTQSLFKTIASMNIIYSYRLAEPEFADSDTIIQNTNGFIASNKTDESTIKFDNNYRVTEFKVPSESSIITISNYNDIPEIKAPL